MDNREVSPEVEKIIKNLEELSTSGTPVAPDIVNLLDFVDYYTNTEVASEEAFVRSIKIEILTHILKLGYVLKAENREAFYKYANVDELYAKIRSGN